MAERASDDEVTHSIAQLYAELTGYLDDQWGRGQQRWVMGEVQKLSDHRSGHGYLDLVDPKVTGRDVPTLKAKCWRSTWGPLKSSLAAAGVALEEGSVVRVRGYVDLYAPRGELGFIITALDVDALRVAALGEHARRREELVRRLTAQGLLEANRALRFPSVPLRVGLVASRGTEGFNDFIGMLEASGFGFRVTLARATVQGASAPAEVAAAISALERTNCEVICVVRGGGSQGDLAAFDDEVVALAIARCTLPVLTGIGHTGDVAVADLVATTSFRTPTACAEGLATIVRDWYARRVALPCARVSDAARAVLDEGEDNVDQARRHLGVVGRQRLGRADDALQTVSSAIARRAPAALRVAARDAAHRVRRLDPATRRLVAAAHESTATRRSLLAAYDPRQLMSRGWSITTTVDGKLVRTVGDLVAGTTLLTRVVDGVARSTVTDVAPETS
jgi:exodeoxyribonuclease VII large subunit